MSSLKVRNSSGTMSFGPVVLWSITIPKFAISRGFISFNLYFHLFHDGDDSKEDFNLIERALSRLMEIALFDWLH